MKQKDIAALLDEPACAHNLKEKSGCAKPGAAAGGCTFGGAQIAMLPIGDVAHIVHGSIACAGHSWDNRGTRSSGPTLYKIGMTTDLTEQDIIMGRGEKRLFHSIKQAIDSYRPAAVFVYNTCVPALTGDDMVAVCKDAQARWGTPGVPIDAAGFYGAKNLGSQIAGEAMVKSVCGTREPDPLPEGIEREGFKIHDICLIGEYNIAGEQVKIGDLEDLELGARAPGGGADHQLARRPHGAASRDSTATGRFPPIRPAGRFPAYLDRLSGHARDPLRSGQHPPDAGKGRNPSLSLAAQTMAGQRAQRRSQTRRVGWVELALSEAEGRSETHHSRQERRSP